MTSLLVLIASYAAIASLASAPTLAGSIAGKTATLAAMALLIGKALDRNGLTWRRIGLRPLTLPEAFLGLGGGLAVFVLGQWLIRDGIANTAAAAFSSRLDAHNPLDRLGLLVSTGLLSSVTEELVYRGVLVGLGTLLLGGGRKGLATAVVVSAAVFSACHALSSVWYYAVYFAFGLVFAGVYASSGSLGAAILAHVIANSIRVLRW